MKADDDAADDDDEDDDAQEANKQQTTSINPSASVSRILCLFQFLSHSIFACLILYLSHSLSLGVSHPLSPSSISLSFIVSSSLKSASHGFSLSLPLPLLYLSLHYACFLLG